MNLTQFEQLSLNILVPALILGMAFIVWDLARKSKAGRFGTFVLFGALGLGVVAFVVKTIVIDSVGGY